MDFDSLYQNNSHIYGNKPSPWVIRIFKHHPHPKRVLDLGVGYGRIAIYLAKKGCDVTGVDVSQAGIDLCLENAKKNKLQIKCICQDLKDYVFERKFDVIITAATLQFLKDQAVIEKVIATMKAHTANGGLNIISVPTSSKIAIEMPFYFTKQQLLEYYRDWEILECEEQEDRFSNGKTGTIAYIIARRK